MMNLSSLTRRHVVVGDDLTVSSARAALTAAEFVVVTSQNDAPVAVLSAADLDELGDADALSTVTERFPPLVTLAAEPDELEFDELVELAELVGREGVRGVLLEGEGFAVLSRRALAEALPLEALDPGGVRYGTPDVAPLRFVCRKCTPPSYLLPRTLNGDPPTCRRVFFHGLMESED
jgi:hypothetical protein